MAKPDAPPDRTVTGAVTRDLAEIAKRSPALASSALAMTALALAAEMDDLHRGDKPNSATSKSMCAKALLDVVNRLMELSPPEQKRDAIDDIAAQRAKKIAAASH